MKKTFLLLLIVIFTSSINAQQVFDSDIINETLEFSEDIKKSLSKLLKQENCWHSFALVKIEKSLESVINQMLHINNYNIIRSRVRKIGKKGMDVHNYTGGVYDIGVDEQKRLTKNLTKDIDFWIDEFDKSTLLLLSDLKKHIRKLNRLVN